MPAFFKENLALIGLFVGFCAFFIALWAAWQVKKINRLRRNFVPGENGGDFETAISALGQKISNLEDDSQVAAAEIKKLAQNFRFAVQKIGIVRYSPFADGGGNYSFSLALLDGYDSGIVITNMYGRQQSRVYTKKLWQGKSEIPLTEEELQAISQAKNQDE